MPQRGRRATAIAALLASTIRAARPSAAVNATKRFCLPHTQRGLGRSCQFVSRVRNSIAVDHRLLAPFLLGEGSLTVNISAKRVQPVRAALPFRPGICVA